jgi:hypothetical protein
MLGGAAFLLSLAVAAWSLFRADALNFVSSWADHNTYLATRWRLFARLTHLEFVNLYTVLPLAGTYLGIVLRRWWTVPPIVALIGIAQYPLAQRRVLLASALFIGATLFVNNLLGRRRAGATPTTAVWPLLLAAVALLALYLIPTLRWEPASNAVVDLVVRYSIPAILYSAFFPRTLPYYPLDIGLDVLGIDRMPDDNIRVQEAWVPGTGYTLQAPFQFVFYSQGGVVMALIGSTLTGMLLGAAWAWILERDTPTPTRSLLGALVISFGAFLAMDSARNAMINSYGVAWGVLFIVGLRLATKASESVMTKHPP